MPLLDAHSGPSYGTLDQMERRDQHEGEQLLPAGYESDDHGSEITSDDSVQEGVRKIEAISLTWTTKSLVVAYVRYVRYVLCELVVLTRCSIFLMAFCTSLEGQTTMSLSAYATSAFSKHSLISTVLVVQNVVNGG